MNSVLPAGCGGPRSPRWPVLMGRLQVPAEAELVIEGFAEPEHYPLMEGPFGNHTGQYDPAGPAVPALPWTRITRRHNPIIPATVVGPPPQEDCWMMLGWERLLAALLPRIGAGGAGYQDTTALGLP